MKPDIWMPMYWADFLADTLHLNRAEIGSYVLLIGAYWRKGSALPDDDESLRNICRCNTQEWMRCKGTMASFFNVGNGLWRHKRIDEEIAQAISNKESQIARTAAATAARLQKNVTNDVTSNVTSIVTFTPSPSPSPSPIQSPTPTPSHTPGACVFGVAELRNAINRLYERKPAEAWSYAEETALCEVSRRENARSELQIIESFKAKLPQADLRYFPQSVSALLSRWTETLDRARAKQRKAKPIATSIVPPLAVANPIDRNQAAEVLRKMKKEMA